MPRPAMIQKVSAGRKHTPPTACGAGGAATARLGAAQVEAAAPDGTRRPCEPLVARVHRRAERIPSGHPLGRVDKKRAPLRVGPAAKGVGTRARVARL